MDLAELGLRIRQVRLERKMSQVELAEACNLSVPYISDIERGKKCFSVDILVRMAKAMQVSADWLLQLDLPQTQYSHNAEATDLLADCTAEEAMLLLKLMQSNKETLRRALKKEHM